MPHDLGGGFPTSRAEGRARAKTREGRQIVWAEVHKGWWLQRWKYRDSLFSLLLLSWRNSHRPCFLSLVRVEEMLEVRRESNKYETVIFWERVRANELWKCSMIARQRFQCLFEVSGHGFKARPVSTAVDFTPASSAIGGRAGFNQGLGFCKWVCWRENAREQRM